MTERQDAFLIYGRTDGISRHGYVRTTVEQVIEPAGVSRKTFYQLFTGKEDAFCAAHAEALGKLGELVRLACESEREWPRKVRAAASPQLPSRLRRRPRAP